MARAHINDDTAASIDALAPQMVVAVHALGGNQQAIGFILNEAMRCDTVFAMSISVYLRMTQWAKTHIQSRAKLSIPMDNKHPT